ncbi:MAG TPA: isoaspartyl peptidase/L-asparaginase [Polyangiaceae bacterium]|jgi:beta-aspartyl-peptidase (threonine type)|nr:isoaspartyl peptidase/L-asparaginase [Polyangiaceae bacterium]
MSPRYPTASPRPTASWGTDGGGWSLLVHGGAGALAPERVPAHVDGCRAAARAGAAVLQAGGTALDAVEQAVRVLESDPLFNAGTGGCLNSDGALELDAAIMEGASLRAGAVCALPPFVHPIAIARAALEDGRHALYAAEGAARFALERGFFRAAPDAMITDAARAQWEAARAAGDSLWLSPGGTVGAVARDASGTVAAATSTGGLVNKRPGRVGDSPVLGAGTHADNDTGAASATGHGEAAMRIGLARAATEALRGRTHPEDAARLAIGALGGRLNANGGLILVDRAGRLGWARNTRTMTWAAVIEGQADAAGA